jgi:hypothetical protein
VIVRAVDDLPDDVPADDRRRGEEHLVALAGEHDAGELRMLGRHLLEVIAPEEADRRIGERLAAEEREAERRTCLRMRANGDGTVTGVFRIPDRHAAMLERALRGLTGPTRIGNQARQDDDGQWKATAEVLGQGLCELIERYPADRIPRLNGVNAQVVVTMTLDQLRGGSGVTLLDGGGEITAGEARRLACEAGVVPMVLGGRSQVLDVGRERRFHTHYQRIAIRHRDQRCTAEGCAVPGHLCHVHHDQVRWADGGGTSVDRGRLLCRWHHGRAHDDRYRMERHPDGSVRFTRRT